VIVECLDESLFSYGSFLHNGFHRLTSVWLVSLWHSRSEYNALMAELSRIFQHVPIWMALYSLIVLMCR